MMFPNNGCFFVWLPNPTADLAGKFSRQSAPQKSTPGGVEAQKKPAQWRAFNLLTGRFSTKLIYANYSRGRTAPVRPE